jgi:hypothetical protein
MQDGRLKTADAGVSPKSSHMGILMKNILKPLLLLSATLFFSSQAAADTGYLKGVGAKLGHGAMNAVTGVGEVPRNMLYETNDKSIDYGLTTGYSRVLDMGSAVRLLTL